MEPIGKKMIFVLKFCHEEILFTSNSKGKFFGSSSKYKLPKVIKLGRSYLDETRLGTFLGFLLINLGAFVVKTIWAHWHLVEVRDGTSPISSSLSLSFECRAITSLDLFIKVMKPFIKPSSSLGIKKLCC